MKRRLFVAASISAALGGCAPVTNALNNNAAIHRVISYDGAFNRFAIGRGALARIYPQSAVTPISTYPIDSLPTPTDPVYAALRSHGFRDYRLAVDGLVERPQRFTLPQLNAMALIDQATRHDCVEGWSVVGRWKGVALGSLLGLVRPMSKARYVVFHAFDVDQQGAKFYDSLDLHQAAQPQTQLALYFNGRPVPADNGGPVRLRVPTQLGYKSTKWVRRIELVDSFKHIGGGNGGYWEDNGYEWFAGI
ncbi:MAG: molybdopterin-dependent oxidoreductase [Candidatus Eremiobacteraeota bacterium]|nr:molybdopterin-dependent oxidoreductase [Candidatus Eremiobacteraeota bacterium]